MGTSKNYSPPTATSWRPQQVILDKYVSNTGQVKKENAFSFVGDYVRANGGASRMARTGGAQGRGMAAQRSASALGGFISDVAGHGLENALRKLGLGDLIGGSVEDILFGLVDRLSGPSSTIDDVDARFAQACLLQELLEDAVTADEVETILKNVYETGQLESLLSRFFALYINALFCKTHCTEVSKKLGGHNADRFFDDVKAYIKEEFILQVDGQDLTRIDWTGQEGQQICQSVMQQTLQTFEDYKL